MKVLVVVDCQNDFITGSLGSKAAQEIVPRIVEKIKSLADDDVLIFTQDEHFANEYFLTQEGKNLPIKHCIFNTDGIKINSDIMTAADEDGREYFRVMLGTGSVIIKPKVDTDCLIAIVHGHEEMTFLISANEAELIVYNDGKNGGIPNVDGLLERLNKIEDDTNNLKTAFSNWIVAPNDGGLALKTSATTWFETQLEKTVKSKLEDTKIAH